MPVTLDNSQECLVALLIRGDKESALAALRTFCGPEGIPEGMRMVNLSIEAVEPDDDQN